MTRTGESTTGPSGPPGHLSVKPFKRCAPIIFALPDVSRSKRKNSKKLDPKNVRFTEGYHHHIIVAAHPDIAPEMDRLVGNDTFRLPPYGDQRKQTIIKTSDCQLIVPEELDFTISYAATYALSRQKVEDDWFIQLPE